MEGYKNLTVIQKISVLDSLYHFLKNRYDFMVIDDCFVYFVKGSFTEISVEFFEVINDFIDWYEKNRLKILLSIKLD